MWAKQLKGHCFALHDLWAGHGEAGAAEAIARTLSCSRQCLPNLGQVKVGRGWERVNIKGDARPLEDKREKDAEKARNRIWVSLTFKIIGVWAGGREAMHQQPCGTGKIKEPGGLGSNPNIVLTSYDAVGRSPNLPVLSLLICKMGSWQLSQGYQS